MCVCVLCVCVVLCCVCVLCCVVCVVLCVLWCVVLRCVALCCVCVCVDTPEAECSIALYAVETNYIHFIMRPRESKLRASMYAHNNNNNNKKVFAQT